MSRCARYCVAETQFDPKVAERDLRRYQRHGPGASTRILLAELRRWPLQGLRLLDVGSGVDVDGLPAAVSLGAGERCGPPRRQ